MENPNAPGNISQKGVNSQTDNETGFDSHATGAQERAKQAQPVASGGAAEQGGVDKELGFDPDSPDVSDPQVDPLHPARTENDPVPKGTRTVDDDELPSSGGTGI